jgi:acetolactate synthase I/II/III large subunit
MTSGSMTGGRALAEALRAHGAGPMFGMGGFQLLPFYEGIRALGLAHHLINDERSGAFAADAYARVSGRVGICDATLGPGATNLVTALVESLNAGVPVVALVGDAHRAYAGRNMTQETRQVDILRPAVKEILRVESPGRVPELVRRAFAVATSGRPGPVVLDIPEDVAHAEHDYATADFQVGEPPRVPYRRSHPDHEDLARAGELLRRARRPLVLAGGGIHLSGAHAALGELARSLGIPVAHTMSGKGAIACEDDLSVGLFGRYSTIANALLESADCLLVAGCKLGEVATKRYSLPPPGVPIIQLDVAAEEIGRWAPVTVGLWGDARAGLTDLTAHLSGAGRGDRDGYLTEVADRKRRWWDEVRERHESAETPVAMARLVHELNRHLPPEAILVADGGFASHWAGLLYRTKRAGRGFVADRGFASIGYGLPGALGAWLAAPGRPVVAMTGDGGLNMTLGELETARRAGAAITVIVVNNAASGYVKALQHAVYGHGSYQSSDLSPTDYAAVARALGCDGVRVEHPDELAPALTKALNHHSGPFVVDVAVTRDPAQMLPGVDSRALHVTPGDRPA